MTAKTSWAAPFQRTLTNEKGTHSLILTVEKSIDQRHFPLTAQPLPCVPCLMLQFPHGTSSLGHETTRGPLGTQFKSVQECGVSQKSGHPRDRGRNEVTPRNRMGRLAPQNIGAASETCPTLLSDLECHVWAVRPSTPLGLLRVVI